MQSTGHSSTQALSLTSMQGSAITYAIPWTFPVVGSSETPIYAPAWINACSTRQRYRGRHASQPARATGTRSDLARRRSNRKPPRVRDYYVYVVELSDEVGPRVRRDRPSVYVGQSVHPPEE